MTDKTPEFIWAIDKVDLGQYVHRDTHQALEAENDKLLQVLRMVVEEYDLTPSGLTLHSIDAHARPALREIEK